MSQSQTSASSAGVMHPDRNLAMELVRATEAAAIRAVPFIGKCDKLAADGAAIVVNDLDEEPAAQTVSFKNR